jgi:hypothetical protein
MYCTIYRRDTFRHVPHIDAAVDLLLKRFFCRTDPVAFAPPWGAACPALGGEALPDMLRAHLGGPKVRVSWQSRTKEGVTRRGAWRIGSYSPAPDGTTAWVVADFDGGEDHADPLADPLAIALTAYRRFWKNGIPCYLERSRSGTGWHLWTFFGKPIPAARARALAFKLLPEDALTVDGNRATIEVFPKRDDLKGCRCGSQVWLPWHCDAAKGKNVFYRPGDRWLIPYIPEDFETAREAAIDHVLQHGGRS